MSEDRRSDDARIADTQQTVHDLADDVRTVLAQHETRLTVLERRADWQGGELDELRVDMKETRKTAEGLRDMFMDHDRQENADRSLLLRRALVASWSALGALASVVTAVLVHFATRGGA